MALPPSRRHAGELSPARPAESSALTAKAALRRRLLAARAARSTTSADDAARAAHLTAVVGRPGRAAVHRSWPDEPGTAALVATWWGVNLPASARLNPPLLTPGLLAPAGLNPVLLAPVLLADDDLDWALVPGPPSLGPTGRASWTEDDPGWQRGRRGTLEPVGPRLGPAAVADCDVVVVPALAVDRDGHRLGRGGGSYDRALARLRPSTLVVALLHDGELVDDVPVEAHDRPVDLVVTPSAAVPVGPHRDRPGGAGLRY